MEYESIEKKGPVIRALYTADHYMQKTVEWVCIATTGVMIILVILQVILRYFFAQSIRGTEELSRLLCVYAALLGGALACRHWELACVTMVTAKLPKALQVVLEYICYALVLGYCVCASLGALSLMKTVIEYNQLTVGLRIPVWVCYLSILVSMLALGIFTINRVIFKLCKVAEADGKDREEGIV